MTFDKGKSEVGAGSGEPSSRPVLLLGAGGQLGSALLQRFRRDPRRFPEVACATWAELEPLLDDPESLKRLLLPQGAGPRGWDVVFALGDTNPASPPEELMRSNLLVVQQAVRALEAEGGNCRYLTFGSIQEHFPGICAANPYLHSKLALGSWMAARSGEGRFLHIRLHTLYGGVVKPYMFLGQILRSLRSGTSFSMSSGDQLREYHHVEDVGESVTRLMASGWGEGVVDLSTGAPLSLASLATAIYAHFGKEALLRIGSLPRPEGENLHRIFPRSPEPWLPCSREAVAGVIGWLEAQLSMP